MGVEIFLHVLVTDTVGQMETYRGKMNGWDLNWPFRVSAQ